MTECDNAEIRDVLPDYVAESLSAVVLSQVTVHLAECAPCREEVALLRMARAARPQAVHVDIQSIVARVGKPARLGASGAGGLSRPSSVPSTPDTEVQSGAPVRSPSLVSHERHRDARRVPRSRVWQMAAAIGVAAIGGWSVYLAQGRDGGVMIGERSDSAMLGEVAERASGSANGLGTVSDRGANAGLVADAGASSDSMSPSRASDVDARARSGRGGVVSVGDLSDYTDAELQRMLDRLDKWDGATSSEVIPTMPIVPVGSTGSD